MSTSFHTIRKQYFTIKTKTSKEKSEQNAQAWENSKFELKAINAQGNSFDMMFSLLFLRSIWLINIPVS